MQDSRLSEAQGVSGLEPRARALDLNSELVKFSKTSEHWNGLVGLAGGLQ